MAYEATLRSVRENLRREDGLTLIELLVVSLMMVVVVTAVFGLYRVSASEQEEVSGTSQGLVAQKNGLERISRELRQATSVCSAYPTCDTTFTNSTSVDFKRYTTGGTLIWVRFNCSGTPAQTVPPNLTTRACLRSQSATAAGLGASEVPVLTNLATTPTGVFSFTAPTYVTMDMRVKVKGANNAIVLEDGVRVRNVNETADSGETG